MAHLVVSDLATELWEAISDTVSEANRPAFLDQTGGVMHGRTANYDALIAVAETVKTNLDMSAFTVDRIGADALAAVEHISPEEATFKDAAELQSIMTTYVNLHDSLLVNLDCSGQGNEEGTLARRMNCFNSFVGPFGRAKNIGLFYCFIVWEGRPTRWSTRRLDPSICVSSAASSDSSSINNNSVRHLTKKQRESAALVNSLREVLHTPLPSGSFSSAMDNGDSSVDLLLYEKRRLFEDKSESERQRKRTDHQAMRSLRSEQLQKAIESAGFNKLSQKQQEELQERWFDSLLLSNSEAEA